jgi:hypothetical protein
MEVAAMFVNTPGTLLSLFLVKEDGEKQAKKCDKDCVDRVEIGRQHI